MQTDIIGKMAGYERIKWRIKWNEAIITGIQKGQALKVGTGWRDHVGRHCKASPHGFPLSEPFGIIPP